MRSTVRVIAVLLALGCTSALAAQSAQLPPRPAGTAVLAGRVVRDNMAVARATVTLDASDGRTKRQTVTDDDGRFEFDRLPAGRFLLTASKMGWVPSHYGSPRPGRPPGAPVSVADGARVSVQIPMVPGSVIAGTIVDDKGRPLPRQFPWLLESRVVGDRRVIARVRFPLDVGFFERSTDDRGEFRLFGLPPGTYYLVVSPSVTSARVTTADEVRWASQAAGSAPPAPGPIVGYAPLFFPGTTDPGAAQPIVVGPGEVKEGLMFRVSPVPVARVAGLVQRPDGAPAERVTVTLTPLESRVRLEGSTRSAVSAADGRFTMQNIAPGTYRLSARASSSAAPAPAPAGAPGGPPSRGPAGAPPVFDLWGDREITVSGQDIENIAIALAPASSVSGRLVFDGTTAKPPDDLSQIRLQAIATEALAQVQAGAGGGQAASAIAGSVQADGTFRAAGLPPDRYTVTASWPGMRTADGASGWWLTTVKVGARDLGDAPIDVRANTEVGDVTVTFSDRIGAIEGQLTDAAGRPAPEYFVVAFSADRAAWTTTSRRFAPPVRPGTDGRYRVNGLLPGDYYLAVVTAVGQEESADPAFLEAILPSAIKITVAAGEVRRQDLKIGR